MPDGFGTYNFPNLKSVTGVFSNNLSDHRPSGVSGEVWFSDFMTRRVGMPRTDSADGWNQNVELVKIGGQAVPNNVLLDPGTTLTLRAYGDVTLLAYEGGGAGSFYAQRILQNTSVLQVTASNLSVNSITPGHTTVSNPSREVDYVDIEFEVTGYGVAAPETVVDDVLNHDATNVNTVLKPGLYDIGGTRLSRVNSDNTIDLLTDKPLFEELKVELVGQNTGGFGGYDWEAGLILHDPNDKIAVSDREYELFTDGASVGTHTASTPNPDQEPIGTWAGKAVPTEGNNGEYQTIFQVTLTDKSTGVQEAELVMTVVWDDGSGTIMGVGNQAIGSYIFVDNNYDGNTYATNVSGTTA